MIKNDFHYSHNISHKEKFKLISELISPEEIRYFLEEQNYSFGMLKDMLQRDYIKEDTNDVIKHVICNKTHQAFANILKSNNFFFDIKKYNKMPQYWKIQYRYPKEYTEEQIREEIKKTSSQGQKKTVEKRLKNGSYKTVEFHKCWSPLTIEFYLNKGWTEEKAKKRIKQICSNGAKKALKRGSRISSIEQKIKEILIDKNTTFSQQFHMKNDNGEDKRIRFFYDFFIIEKNILLEVNGDFFHANPIFYKADDIIFHPENKTLAKDIWERDRKKIDFAINKGYDVLVLWEYDINHNLEVVKERLINAGIY
jgi:G:T-mismatch repair DNA endonuclease (very short patch repair protein)